MTPKFLAIDFEYKNSHNASPELVAVAHRKSDSQLSQVVWLYKDLKQIKDYADHLKLFRDDYIFLSFNVDAEAKSLISLGLNPINFKWIDLQAEWKMLVNHCDKYRYGKHLINGTEKTTFRKKYGDQEDKRAHDRPPVNLLGCMYKLLGNVGPGDVTKKDEMRRLILNTHHYNRDEVMEILEYARSDVEDLVKLYWSQIEAFKKIIPKFDEEEFRKEQLWRGESVARAAVISALGYPVNREKVVNFTKNIPKIIEDCQEDINEQFSEMEVFKWNKKAERYSLNTKAVKTWISESKYASVWDKTPTQDYSLSLDAFERHFHFRHDFPRDNFPAQFLRYLKLNQSLNGFKPKSVTAKNRETFFSYYGEDNRAHAYLNSYGAQSSRYQPKATGFIHLKAAWMRSLVEPRKNRAIAAIDYSSEEFLLSALLSNDSNMLKAYDSGDVYLYFAKLAGAVPWDGKKADYKEARDLFKATTLGISYQMGSAALARKLSQDTGRDVSQEEAIDLISKFYDAYSDYAAWIKENENFYSQEEYLKLPDGWYMFGDNDNIRSVGNMPIQGMGAAILRKAIQLCQDAGLKVIIPLHDALYIEYPAGELEYIDRFEQCMRDAFCFYFTGSQYQLAKKLIRMDCDTWSPNYSDGSLETPKGLKVKAQKLYIDERSEKEYAQFSKYFKPIQGE